MTIKNAAGNEETLTQEQYDALVASGHAKRLTIISDSDYEPEELKLTADKPAEPVKAQADKDKAKAGDGKQA